MTVSTDSAVYAARVTDHPGNASGPLPFDRGNENLIGVMWDNSSHSFTMRAAEGFYYITMNAATRAGNYLEIIDLLKAIAHWLCLHWLCLLKNVMNI